MKKRFIAFLLVLIMVLGMLPVSAMAANSTGHQISVKVYKVVLDSTKPLDYQDPVLIQTKIVTCQDGVGHSGYTHSVKLSEFYPTTVGVTTTDWTGYQFSETGYQLGQDQGTFYNWKNDTIQAPANVTGSEPYPCSKDFYLVYKDPNVTYTLTYDANGGTGAPNAQTAKSSTGSATFTIPDTTPTRDDGFKFAGWSTSKNGTAQYQPNGLITIKQDTTLYAVWQCNHTHEDGFCTVDGCQHDDDCCPKKSEVPGPSAPSEEELAGKDWVKVSCTTENSGHTPVTYSLSRGQYEISKPVKLDTKYTCTVTVHAAGYVAAYSSTDRGAHTLVSTSPAYITLTYENNGWTNNGKTADFNVKCVTAPTEDNIHEIGSLCVNVKCTTETEKNHPKVGFALAKEDYGTAYTVGAVQGNETTGYTCDVTVHAAKYVTKYGQQTYVENGQTVAYGDHQLKQGETTPKVVTLVYDKTTGKWTVPVSNEVTFQVVCGSTPPTDNTTVNVYVQVRHNNENVYQQFKSTDFGTNVVAAKDNRYFVGSLTTTETLSDMTVSDSGFDSLVTKFAYQQMALGTDNWTPATGVDKNFIWAREIYFTELKEQADGSYDLYGQILVYELKLDTKGGTMGNDPSGYYLSGTEVTFPYPTKAGFEFTGWTQKTSSGSDGGDIDMGGWTPPKLSLRDSGIAVLALPQQQSTELSEDEEWEANWKDITPSEDNIDSNMEIYVECTTNKAAHVRQTYKLIANSYTAGTITLDANGNQFCELMVKTADYITKFNADTKVTHTAQKSTIVIPMMWDTTDSKWHIYKESDAEPNVIKASCKPSRPPLNVSLVWVECENTTAGHPYNGKFKFGLYESSGANRFTVDTDAEGNEIVKDETTGKWTFTITLDRAKYVAAFSATSDIGSAHTDLYPNEVTKITWTWNGTKWEMSEEPVIKVNCEHPIYAYFQAVDTNRKVLALEKETLGRLKLTYNTSPNNWFTYGKLMSASTTVDDVWNELVNGKTVDQSASGNPDFKYGDRIRWTALDKKPANWHDVYIDDANGEAYHLDGQLTLYRVTFNNGLPAGSTETVDNMPTNSYGDIYDYYVSGEPVKIPDKTPTRDGYTFLGWEVTDNSPSALSLTGAAADGLYKPNGTYTVKCDNMVFTAKWEKNVYDVSISARLYGKNIGFITNAKVSVGDNLYEKIQEALNAAHPYQTTKTMFEVWEAKNAKALKGYHTDITTVYDHEKTNAEITSDMIFDLNSTRGVHIEYLPNTDTHYTVKYVLETLDPKHPWDKNDTIYPTATTDSFVVAQVKDFTGFTFDKDNDKNVTEGYVKGDGSLLLVLYYTRNTYKVIFNLNGGNKDGDTAEVEHTFKYQAPIDASEINFTPERTGYTFKGWDASIPDTMPAENVTLTAQWEPKNDVSYTVKYLHENGKELKAPKTVEKQTFDSTVTEQALAIPGYKVDAEEKTLKLDAYNKELVFTYTPIKYTVTFDENGGTLTGVKTKTVSFGSKYGRLSTAERDGYTFKGWFTEKVDGTKIGEKTLVNIADNHTLYAQWEANPLVIVYHGNGGTLENGKDQSTSNSFTDKEATIKNNPFTRTGYTFLGWTTVKDGETIAFTGGEKHAFSASEITNGKVEFWAKWEANQYTVKFDPNAESGEYEGTMADQPFTYDVEQALKANAFTKTGYSFDGWNTQKDGKGKAYADKESVKNLATKGTVTLYAQWKINQYTITFDTDGGSKIDPITQDYGTTVTAPDDPTKTGYTFVGWDVAIPATMPAKNMTITAKWKINQYTITFDTKGGTEIAPITQDYGTTVVAPANPTKTGYTFAGWDVAIPGTMPAQNMTITAKWTINQYTITFKPENGDKDFTVTQDYGTTVVAPKEPTRGGYWFDGWYDLTDNSKVTFPFTLTHDMTVYARWTMIVLPSNVTKKTPKLNTADHFAYVQGYPDGTVKPAGNITRAETAAILFRLMDESSRNTYYSTKSGFRDVASGAWYNTYVATLNNAGVITDSANGYFRPNDAITRAELAAMLASFTESTRAANYFNDVTANYWAANAIAICAKLGWITGYPDGSFRPDRNVTRAELMAMINRATGRAPKSADAFLPGMKTWSDNTADKWYYLDVQEATNSHSYTVKPTEIWTAITAAPNWSKYE